MLRANFLSIKSTNINLWQFTRMIGSRCAIVGVVLLYERGRIYVIRDDEQYIENISRNGLSNKRVLAKSQKLIFIDY